MVIRRPSVFIYTYRPDVESLKEICAGIEEEGVFFEVFEREEKKCAELAWEAARDSMLGSGIGINGGFAALSIRGLKEGECADILNEPDKRALRRLGGNSARIVKKQAFKVPSGPEEG